MPDVIGADPTVPQMPQDEFKQLSHFTSFSFSTTAFEQRNNYLIVQAVNGRHSLEDMAQANRTLVEALAVMPDNSNPLLYIDVSKMRIGFSFSGWTFLNELGRQLIRTKGLFVLSSSDFLHRKMAAAGIGFGLPREHILITGGGAPEEILEAVRSGYMEFLGSQTDRLTPDIAGQILSVASTARS